MAHPIVIVGAAVGLLMLRRPVALRVRPYDAPLRFGESRDACVSHALGHHHTIYVGSDVMIPRGGRRTFETSLDNGHTHTITLSEQDLFYLRSGQIPPRVTSSDRSASGVYHTHQLIRCADLQSGGGGFSFARY